MRAKPFSSTDSGCTMPRRMIDSAKWGAAAGVSALLALTAVAPVSAQTLPPVEAPAPQTSAKPNSNVTKNDQRWDVDAAAFDIFLDRLMLAESGGANFASNPKSTALGPYQFIESTFIDIADRYLQAETANLTRPQILALRTDRAIARKAAAAYARENAVFLVQRGVPSTFVNLRLAYLLGPTGAVKILTAKPNTAVATLISAAALRANPFLASLSVQDLRQRAAAEIKIAENKILIAMPGPGETLENTPGYVRVGRAAPAPAIRVTCNLKRPSCRRWLALKKRSLKSQTAQR